MRLLDWGLARCASPVCTAIAALLALALRATRATRAAWDTSQTPQEAQAGGDAAGRAANRMVAIGTAISTVLLLGALIAMLRVLAAVADPPRVSALTVGGTPARIPGTRRV